MIRIPRLAPRAAFPLCTRLQSPRHLPHAAWASSLSAIHRGIHRGNGSGRQDFNRSSNPRGSSGPPSGGRQDFKRPSYGSSGPSGGRQDFKRRSYESSGPSGGRQDFKRPSYGSSGPPSGGRQDFKRPFNPRGSSGPPGGRQDFKRPSDPRGSLGPSRAPAEKERAASVDDDTEPGRQTRRKRFNDPSSDFGKKSLVYRIKYGDLKDKADNILAKNEQEQSDFRNTGSTGRNTRSERRDSRGRGEEGAPDARSHQSPREDTKPWQRDAGGRGEEGPWDAMARQSRPARDSTGGRGEGGRSEFRSRRPPARDDAQPWRRDDRGGGDEGGARRSRPREDAKPWRRDDGGRGEDGAGTRRPWAPREGRGEEGAPNAGARRPWAPRDHDDGEAGVQTRGPKRHPHPISLRRTTAASQFIFGSSVVTAALTMSRRKLYHLYILEGGKRGPEGAGYNSPRTLAERRGVPITIVKDQGAALLEKMSGGRPHNGYVLEASPLPQLPVTSLGPLAPNPWKPEIEVVLGRQSREDEAINGTGTTVHCQPNKNQKPLVLLLNEVLDPANLGAMIRSAWFLGASAVAITAQGSATLTPVALKASAGAAEEMPIFSVESAMDFITASKEAGWKSYAAAPALLGKDKKRTTIKQVEEQNPLAESGCILILGSEGQGLPKPLRRAADFEISIPGASRSSVDSLNVSVAGGILCNAFLNPHPARSANGSQSQTTESPEEAFWSGVAESPKEESQGGVTESPEVDSRSEVTESPKEGRAEGEVEEKQTGKETGEGGLF